MVSTADSAVVSSATATSSGTATVSSGATATSSATATSPREWRWWVGVTIIFLILSGVVTARYMQVHTALSPYDEYVFVDAVDKARHGVVTRDGQMVGDYAREVIACRGWGTAPESTKLMGTCGVESTNSEVPYGGYTTAGVHSPVYYFLTAWLSWPIEKILGVELLTAARITSALWLGLGMTALAYLLRRLGSRWDMAIAIPILVMSMPTFRSTNSYITPDAPNLLFGSLILLGAYLYARREWSAWPLILISTVATIFKFQNIFAVVAVVLFLLWYRLAPGKERDPAHLPRWSGILALPIFSGIVAGGWMFMRAKLALPAGNFYLDPPAHLDLGKTIYAADDTLRIIFAGTEGTGSLSPESIFPSLVLWLCVGSLCAAAFFGQGGNMIERRLAQSGLLSLVAIGPATTIAFAVVFDAHVTMQFRYSMVLVPILVSCLGTRIERPAVRWGFYTLTALAYLFAVVFVHAN